MTISCILPQLGGNRSFSRITLYLISIKVPPLSWTVLALSADKPCSLPLGTGVTSFITKSERGSSGETSKVREYAII